MRLFSLALLLPLSASPLAAQAPEYDLVIRNGRIVDGTGSPWYAADLGIRAGRIAAIGRLDAAKGKQTVDARGQVVAPGFIDMLGQSELAILADPRLPSKIFQGITTEITGEGGSPAPLNDAIVAADQAGYEQLGVRPDWRTLAQYYARLERQGIGINIATYVGATQVRRMVLGDDDTDPTPAQLDQMRAAGAPGDARRRGGALDLASIPASSLRRDAGADRARDRGGEAGWDLRHPSPERE